MKQPYTDLLRTKLMLVCTLLVLSLFSCMTPQKATHYLKKKNLLADSCAANFPVKDSLIVRDSVSIDTVYTETPNEQYLEISKEWSDTARELKPAQIRTLTITKTIRHDSIIYQRDMARETVLVKQVGQAIDTVHERDKTIAVRDAKVAEQKDEIKSMSRTKLYLWLAVIALLVALFRKPIFSTLATVINPIKAILPI